MKNKNFDILKAFGKRIREKRDLLKISQEELAFESGMHRTYIGAVERGEKNISLKNIYKITRALKITISEITKDID